MYAVALGGVEEVERGFGAEEGAAQVHEDDDAGFVEDAFNGGNDFHGVRADGVFGVVHAAGNGDADAPLCHLIHEFLHAAGQLGAVGDDYDADHVFLCGAPGAGVR